MTLIARQACPSGNRQGLFALTDSACSLAQSAFTGLAFVLLAVLAGCQGQDDNANLPQARLVVGQLVIRAEIAREEADRERGLMHRTQLAQDAGMLFVFPRAGRYCFWMKNTALPLSIAFLDNNGRMLNFADMEPRTERKYCADGLASYALEVNRGVFLAAGVPAGARIYGLPQEP